jgi:hypothetical protein
MQGVFMVAAGFSILADKILEAQGQYQFANL